VTGVPTSADATVWFASLRDPEFLTNSTIGAAGTDGTYLRSNYLERLSVELAHASERLEQLERCKALGRMERLERTGLRDERSAVAAGRA
jgi:hypothetical protein